VTLVFRKRFWFFLIAFTMMALVWSTPEAFAQDTQSYNKGQKRATVDFEDQLVQGEVKKPELFYLLQKKQFNFGKLIKLRENFIPEMQQTAEDIEKVK
jgi:hypothetical protein